ncbi:MAG: ABC transporter permease [Candidatus Coatesbacteria bacterium]|nr:ABC transporter permease [Candidatus Coatesbacteria bacterium]
MRSGLTLLGIIIGVSTVIAVISIVNGMNDYVAEKIAVMGPGVFFVEKFGIVRGREDWLKRMRWKNLSINEYEALSKQMMEAEAVAAMLSRSRRITYKDLYISSTSVRGATANYLSVSEIAVEDGRFFTEFEEQRRAHIVVIGSDIKKALFEDVDPIDKIIDIGGVKYKIIGVFETAGSVLGNSQDNFVVIPLKTYLVYYSGLYRRSSWTIGIKIKDPDRMFEAQEEARSILRRVRKIPSNKEDDFSFISPEAVMNFFEEFSGIAFIVLIGISSISLVVGGIVIMNIMLVSVTERTKEIGIRKAIGAKRGDILMQFLIESVLLSLFGGLAGVIAGYLLSQAVAHFSPLPSAVKPWTVFLGVAVASSVGLFFGIYPAWKASKLDPIIALSYEH